MNCRQVFINSKTRIMKTATADKKVVHAQKNYEAKLEVVLAAQAEADLVKAEEKAERKAKSQKPGIIATIFGTIKNAKKPVSKEQILEVLVLEFANETHNESTMRKTINAQLGNKRPNRMEREKLVIFDVTQNAEGFNLYAYSE